MAVDLSRFLPQYFEESGQSLLEIKRCLAALAGADWDANLADAASRAAHCIKGNSGAFGFDEIENLAADLEYVLRKSGDGFGRENATFFQACERVCAVLAALLQARQAGHVGDVENAREQAKDLLACLQAGQLATQGGVCD